MIEYAITRLFELVIIFLAGFWQALVRDFNLLEVLLIAAGVYAWKKRGWRPNLGIPRLNPILIAIAALALRIALIPVIPVPTPVIPDESSQLLLADTLLHGRVANPTHSFWPHFESLHIIQQPSYVSNYFPGHAAFLALGRAILHSAWSGVLAECFIFLLVLYWMLKGWMPSRWAAFGVLLAALRFAIGSYWINAFHGGFLPAIGGALIAGAYPRRNGLLLGLGLVILISTRPFEGVFYAAPFIIAILPHKRAAIPAIGLACLGVIGLGLFNKAITGDPFTAPYAISRKVYGWPMTTAGIVPPPITNHHHIEFKRYYDYERTELERVSDPIYFVEYLPLRLQEYWRFYLGPVLTVPFIMLPRVWRRRRLRLLFFGFIGALIPVLLTGATLPHYLAAATAVLFAILVECCRHLQAAKVRILPLLPASMVLILVLRIAAQAAGLPFSQTSNFQSWCCRQPGDQNQAILTRRLEAIPGNHLVFVKPKSEKASEHQWIYNDADIDHARIVWARDLGPERNRALIEAFSGRQVWIVDPNTGISETYSQK